MFVNLVSVSSLVLVLVVIRTVLHYLETRRIKSLGAEPRKIKSWLPFGVGTFYALTKANANDETLECLTTLFQEHGHPTNPYTIKANVAGRRLLLTADPENIKALLANQFKSYGKGSQLKATWRTLLGQTGIFTADGEAWHSARQLLRPQFNKNRSTDTSTFEHLMPRLLSLLRGSRPGEPVDIDPIFKRYTLDTTTHFLLGQSVDTMRDDSAQIEHAFTHAVHILAFKSRLGNLSWLLPSWLIRSHVAKIHRLEDHYINAALALSPEELQKRACSGDATSYTFLHELVGYTRDRSVLRDQLTNTLVAGRDTTAASLTWLLYELSQSAGVMAKLRSEIRDTVGDRLPTHNDLKGMRYLQNCINEVLRLRPVISMNLRVALHDTTLPHGGGPDGNSPIGILKGTPIAYVPLVLSRRADIYPPVASGFPPIDKFAPERWDYWTPQSWTYSPFSGGPRICLGQGFANNEIGYTVTRILQTFDNIQNCMDAEPKMKMDITMEPRGAVKVRFM